MVTPLTPHFRLPNKQFLTTTEEKKNMEHMPYANVVKNLM